MSDATHHAPHLEVQQPLSPEMANTQEYPYESIKARLQSQAVYDNPFGRRISLAKSNEEISAITSQVASHPYFQRLGRPDFTRYTIDYKIWHHFFVNNNGESMVPFNAVNPLNARPLDPTIDLSSMPPNPFPVFVPVMNPAYYHAATQMRGGGGSAQNGLRSPFNHPEEYQVEQMPNIARHDSGYTSSSGERPMGAQQPINVDDVIDIVGMRREQLEVQIKHTLAEARRCEDEARIFVKRGQWLMAQVERLEIQLMEANEEEEDQFCMQDRMAQLEKERDMLDDEMSRLAKKMRQ